MEATPLHEAASCGDTVRVAAVLAGGAAVDATNAGGSTPLHFAAGRDHSAMVTALLAAGAAVDAT